MNLHVVVMIQKPIKDNVDAKIGNTINKPGGW